jgi:hypothetical protein
MRLPFRSALALGAAFAILVTAGCAADTAPEVEASVSPMPASTSSETDAATDEASCAGVGDVLTILHNVDAAVKDARMSDQERDGWYALAVRVLDRVSASGEGPISDALLAFKPTVPPGPPVEDGASLLESVGAAAEGGTLREACEAAGYEMAIEGFIGG